MHDVLIIGSGFGGAMAALQLASSGANVTLLERGPWRDTLPLQDTGIENKAPLPQGWRFFSHALLRAHHPLLPAAGLSLHRHGLLELFAGKDIRVVCTSSVGGGSHAYGGLNARPLQADYWDDIADGLHSQLLEPHYQAAMALMGAVSPQDGYLPTAPAIVPPLMDSPFVDVDDHHKPAWAYLMPEKHGQGKQREWRGLQRREAVFEQEGPFGSPQGGKTTLDIACLLPAMEHGLKVQDNCEVLSIRQGRHGYIVSCRCRQTGKITEQSSARLILAAGTLNTVKLLLHSRAQGKLAGMPALGRGFAANADVMAWWPVNTAGANHPAHGIYQRLFRHRDDRQGPLMLQAGMAGLHALPLPAFIKKRMQQDLFIAAMGIDDASGVLSWQNGRLHMAYNKNQPIYQRIDEHLAKLAQLSGRRLFKGATPTTVHPVGGAIAGSSGKTAVVNGYGEVYGLPGLYIADGSALPAATGSPPSMTIAAWARHVAEGISRRG